MSFGQFNPFNLAKPVMEGLMKQPIKEEVLKTQRSPEIDSRYNAMMSKQVPQAPAMPMTPQQQPIMQPAKIQVNPDRQQNPDWMSQWGQNLQSHYNQQQPTNPVAPVQPSIQPLTPPINTPKMEDVPMEGIDTKQESGLDLDSKLNSDDPGVFSNAMEELGTLDEGKLPTESPAAKMIQRADRQYGMGTTEDGEKVYQCPLTKTPCGRKTFWTRLKEFFQSMLGLKSREDAVKSVSSLKDPITSQYTSGKQVQAQKPAASSAWNSRGQQ